MQGYWTQLNDYAYKKDFIRKISEKTTIQPAAIFLSIATFVFLMVIRGICNLIIILFLIVVVPAYQSFKVLKAKDAESAKNWAKYWVVLGLIISLFQVFEFFIDFIPFIGFIKPGIAYLLVRNNGSFAITLFNTYIGPLYEHYESLIDSKLEPAQSTGIKDSSEIRAKAVEATLSEAKTTENPRRK